VLPFLWALLVGLVFSMIGAAGGILAAVGHLTVLGMSDANTVKAMNQLLVIVSPIVAVPAYWRQERVVPSLALLLGTGSIVGAVTGSGYSKTHLATLAQYRPLFGLLTLFIAARLLYEATARFRERHRKIRESSEAFEAARRGTPRKRLLTVTWRFSGLRILFLGQEFTCRILSPVLAGFLIAFLSAALGVGGGFLLVPYLASWLELPMFLVAGTSALAVLVASLMSVTNYLYLGVSVDWPLALLEVTGVVVGSLVGPWVSGQMRERWLRLILAAVLLSTGVSYAAGAWLWR
jgi:uncharacterized membrane protein YfcA